MEVIEKTKEINKTNEIFFREYMYMKNIKIFGISIWRICAYFIIYSFLGFIIETAFGLVTKGVIESRRSSLYMPICSIYGAGAIVMILRITTI